MGLTVRRHTNILTLAAALLLALGALATAAAFQLRPAGPAVSVPAPLAGVAPYTGPCRSDIAGCVPDETLIPGVPAALPIAWTGTCRAGSAGCEPEEALVPGIPAIAPAPYTGPCRSDIAGCVPDEAFIPGVGAVSR